MKPRSALFRVVTVALLAVGCGTEPRAESPGGNASAELTKPEGPCEVQTATPEDEGGAHVAACSAISPRTRPPASGPHYGTWPVFRAYDKPVPWGFLLHGLEHGAVVIAYNCPEGCADEVAAAKAMIAKLPRKPACPTASVILTPDPTLDTRFAASAWRRILRARCFDRERFAQFVMRHVDLGPERFATDCGLVDMEATGWCPGGNP